VKYAGEAGRSFGGRNLADDSDADGSDTLGLPVPSETQELIEMGVRRFLEEVPALKQLKVVIRLDLRARRDSQTWRVALPELEVTKDPAADAKVTVLAPRSHFNELARDGRLQHWRDAYENGYVRVVGQDEIIKLIGRVIERHETRQKVKKRRL
jgi:hypothetical protein